MSSKDNVVSESLSSFGSLRTALAYLRSISIILEDEQDKLRSMISKEIRTMAAQNQEEAEALEQCYYRATISVYVALLYAVLKPESTEGGRRVSVLKRQEGAPVNLG